MKNISRLFTAMLAVAVLAGVGGLRLSAQPLDSLVRRALDVHPSLEASRLAVEQAEAKASGAGAWQPPMVGLETRMLPPLNPNPITRGETMVMVEQSIPLFGQNRLRQESMRLAAPIREEEMRGTEIGLRADVADLYYRIASLDRLRDLNRTDRNLTEIFYREAESVYEFGGTSQAELYDIAVEIRRLETELLDINIRRRSLQESLNTILGREMADTIISSDSLPAPALPPFDALVSMLDAAPGLRRMEAMAAMSDAQAEAAEAELDPMLTLRGGVAVMPDGHPVRMDRLQPMVSEITTGGSIESEHLGLMVGAMISIPIAPWASDGPKGRAEASRVEARQAIAERASMRTDMIERLRRVYGEAEQNLIWIDHFTTGEIPLLEQGLQVRRDAYAEGTGSVDHVLDALERLIKARRTVLTHRTEFALALANLERIVGQPL